MRFLVDLHVVYRDSDLVTLGDRLLSTVVDNNVELLGRYPQVPPLYKSGVVYRAEPWAVGAQRYDGGLEQFCHLLTILDRGWGDCAQLCAWRVAELRAGGWRTPDAPGGEQAQLRYYIRASCPQCRAHCSNLAHPQRRRSFHVEVRRAPSALHPEGLIEDPSRLLSY